MPDIRTPWRAVAAMFILNGALFGIWASRIPATAEKHGLSPGALGLLLLLMAAGAIAAFPLAGRASDRHGAARVTRRIALAYTASLLLIAVSPNLWTLGSALFLFGAMHGGMDVAMNSWAAEAERHIARPVMSSFHAMFSFGAGIGAASGYLAASLGLSVAAHFPLAALLIAAPTLWLAAIPWASGTSAASHAGPVYSLPRGPLVMAGIAAFCASLGEGAMADWSAVFLVSVASVSEATAALGYTIFSLTMVGMRLIGDRIVQRTGPVTAARLAGLTAAAGSAMAVLLGTLPAILTGFALMGIGYAVIMPLAFSRAANDPNIAQGSAIASVATLGYGGILLGPPLIGFIAEATSIRAAFLLLSLLALTITLTAPALSRAPRTALPATG